MKIAVLGFGVVGSGVVEVMQGNAAEIAERANESIVVKYILDIRDFPDSPYADLFVKDFAVIENDPEVEVVVECIGGARIALDFSKRALLAGKHLVSSNKELVAEHGAELLSLARSRNLNYLFEASVGGGIPIIRPISQCLAANRLEDVYGILNGTSNYILSRMVRGGVSFSDAHQEARLNGYAEADPTDDVEGKDACRKICILAALAYGRHVYPRFVFTEGIGGITPEDVAFAHQNGYTVKLLGRAKRLANGNVAVYVAPHLVPADSPLYAVEDVFNGIVVSGNAIGEVMFYGRGAGKMPTASAMVADVIDAAKHRRARKDIQWQEGDGSFVEGPEAVPCRWYARARGSEGEYGLLTGDVSPEFPADAFADTILFKMRVL